MTEQAFAILLASAFTFGCAVIHECREYARYLTPILAGVTASLVLCTTMIVVAQNGAASPPGRDIKSAAQTGRVQPR